VPFEPGALRAIGRNKGQTAARYELRTAGEAARVHLAADRAEMDFRWDDVVYLRATVVDSQGVPVPGATHAITFKGNGPAVIVAVDNGDNNWHDSFRGSSCKALDGQCVVILKAKAGEGIVRMTASAPGLAESEPVTIAVSGMAR
jgi:beta-galactosidase